MVLVSNQTGLEIGYLAGRYPGAIGHLYSPGGQRGPWAWMPYALDNGAWPAYKNGRPWDETEWRWLLRWAQCSGQQPLWAVVPDVVGEREATLERWHKYVGVVRAHGFRPALALQDGMTFDDVPDAECILFVGGSTEWKLAAIGPWCERFPGRVHVARVNTMHRLLRCWHSGVISIDGTGWFRRGNGGANQAGDLRRFLAETATTRDRV
jgi:hypothetical protein